MQFEETYENTDNARLYLKGLRFNGGEPDRTMTVTETRRFMEKLGISLDDVDKLNVIHIAGTKGKGSTCSYVERILRGHGIKTGFFSSPHLVDREERIRIAGVPISPETFTSHFWEIYNKTVLGLDEKDVVSFPFQLFLLMAFKIFIEAQVDVAVLEVGIGGEQDATNVVLNPVVCGITTLELDHTEILGHTIDKIAWHKAGIIKPGVPVFTVPQPQSAMQVIKSRAEEKNSPVFVTPAYSQYDWGGKEVQLPMKSEFQKVNASLALQITNAWLKRHKLSVKDRFLPYTDTNHIPEAAPFIVPFRSRLALKNCQVQGRLQIERHEDVTYFIDMSHTPKSIAGCVQWFREESEKDAAARGGKVRKYLMYHTFTRDVTELMPQLAELTWDTAVFCTSFTNARVRVNSFKKEKVQSQVEKIKFNESFWKELMRQRGVEPRTQYLEAVAEATDWCHQDARRNNSSAHILYCGSGTIAGSALRNLRDNIRSTTTK